MTAVRSNQSGHTAGRSFGQVVTAIESTALARAQGARVRAILPRGRGGVACLVSAERDAGGRRTAAAANSGSIAARSVRWPSPGLGAVVEPLEPSAWRFELIKATDDTELGSVGRLLRGESCLELGGASIVDAKLRAYRPRRRAQVELALDDGRHLFAKVTRRRAARRTAAVLGVLQHAVSGERNRRVGFPRLCGLDDRAHCVVTEAVRGETLFSALQGGAARDALPRVGAALATLHDLDGGDLHTELPMLDIRQRGEWLARCVDLLRRLGSEESEGIAAAARSTGAKMCQSKRRGLVHGDFHDRQVIVGDRIVVLDGEGASIGDPAVDVGNFLAQLRLRSIQGATALGADALRELFLEGYGRSWSGEDWRAVVGWEAVSLVRLAAVYALRPRWRYLSRELVRDAIMIAAAPRDEL